MAKLQNSCRPFSLEKFKYRGHRSIRSHAPDDPVTGSWRGGGESLEGRRTVTGGAEDTHWRGGGHSLEGRLTEESHWRGGGQSLEGRRTATGGAEDSDWNDRCLWKPRSTISARNILTFAAPGAEASGALRRLAALCGQLRRTNSYAEGCGTLAEAL